MIKEKELINSLCIVRCLDDYDQLRTSTFINAMNVLCSSLYRYSRQDTHSFLIREDVGTTIIIYLDRIKKKYRYHILSRSYDMSCKRDRASAHNHNKGMINDHGTRLPKRYKKVLRGFIKAYVPSYAIPPRPSALVHGKQSKNRKW